MRILLRLDEPAWRRIGQRTLTLELEGTNCTLGDLIAELGRRFPGIDMELAGQNGDMVPYSLFLNDESVRWAEVGQVSVKDGDCLRVILPIAGG